MLTLKISFALPFTRCPRERDQAAQPCSPGSRGLDTEGQACTPPPPRKQGDRAQVLRGQRKEEGTGHFGGDSEQETELPSSRNVTATIIPTAVSKRLGEPAVTPEECEERLLVEAAVGQWGPGLRLSFLDRVVFQGRDPTPQIKHLRHQLPRSVSFP